MTQALSTTADAALGAREEGGALAVKERTGGLSSRGGGSLEHQADGCGVYFVKGCAGGKALPTTAQLPIEQEQRRK